MGKINAAWRVAMSTMGQNFTKAEHDAGWPESLKHGQLAALQYPYVKGEPAKIRLARDRAGDILSACKSGELPHTATTATVTPPPLPIQRRNEFASSEWLNEFGRSNEFGRFGSLGVRNGRITSQPPPQPHDVTTYTVTAPAFAAWLAAQPEPPSEHIAAWFEAVVAGAALDAPTPEANGTPIVESIDDRNLRWLNRYETEEHAGKRGAYNRAAAHFEVEASTLRKAVNKARDQRTARNRGGIKAVARKGVASPFAGLVTTIKDGKRTTKHQR